MRGKFVYLAICFFSLRLYASTFSNIDFALKEGRISKDEAALYLAYALAEPELVPYEFRSMEREKCGTSFVLGLLFDSTTVSHSTRSAIMSVLSRPVLPNRFDTLHFRIHYTLTGPDRVPNEAYVHRVAQYFEQVYRHLVVELGYTPPPSDGTAGGNSLYDVYIKRLDVYGYTEPESPGPEPWNDYTSFIVINNDYSGFYTTGDNAIRVTAAHEFHHAIQFAYNVYADRWFMECCAVWSEEENYPTINDCYQYTSSFFGNPELSLTDETNSMHMYSTFIWAKFLSMRWTPGIIKSIWEAQRTNTTLSSIQNALSSRGSSRNAAFSEFVRVNYFTGTRTSSESYDDARDYPLIRIEATHNSYPVSGRRPSVLPSALSASYIVFNYPPGASGPFTITFDGADGFIWNVQILKMRADLSYDISSISLNSANYGQIEIDDWSSYDRIVMIPTLLSTSGNNVEYVYSAAFETITPTLPPPRNLRALSGISGEVPLYWDAPTGVGFEEIAYDDGVPVYYYATNSNDIISVRFTPASACTIKEAKIWFVTDADPPYPDVELHIWADDGDGFPDFTSDLMPPRVISGSTLLFGGWTSVDLSSTPVVINPVSEFHIGVKFPSGVISVYTDEALSDGSEVPRSLYYQASDGNFYLVAGDFLIRAGVRYISTRMKKYVSCEKRGLFSGVPRALGRAMRAPFLFASLSSLRPEDEPLEYFIYRANTTGGPYNFLASVPGSVTNYTDRAVTDGVTYYYVVRASYRGGLSSPTNEAQATPGRPVSLTDTLRVDNNNLNPGFYWAPSRSKFANKFHTDNPCQVLRLFYLTAGEGEFVPNVYRFSGTTVGSAYMPDEAVEGENGRWTVVDVSMYDVYVVGDFLVSFGIVDTTLALAADPSGGEGIGWDYFDGVWVATEYKYYIRVEVRYLTAGETYTYSGTVELADMPPSMAGSLVRLQGTSFADTTDSRGQFSIAGIPPGIYTVRITHPGYQPYTNEIAIYSNRYQHITLVPYVAPATPPRFLQARSYLDRRVELYWRRPYGQPGTVEEIQYDDGYPRFYYPGSIGDIEDVRFTVHYPCTLMYVALAFYDSLGRYPRVRIGIFEDDMNGYPDTSARITAPIDTTPVPFSPTSVIRWTILDLSSRNIVLAPGVDFHISYIHINASPALITDTLPSESPSRSNLYISSLRSWQERPDYMCRVIVKYYGLAKVLEPSGKESVIEHFSPECLFGVSIPDVFPRAGSVLESMRPEGLLRYYIIRGLSSTSLTYLDETSDTFYIDTTVVNGTRYYYQVKAIYTVGESEFSNVASAKPIASSAEPKVLLVDDDGSCFDSRAVDEGELYIQYMNELSVPFKAIELLYCEDGPSADEMRAYRAVLWWTGIGYTGGVTLSDNDESALAEYLDSGGRLFLVGQDYLWDKYLSTTRFSSGQFPYDYLTITSVVQDHWEFPRDTNMTLVGQDSTIAEGMRFGIRNPYPSWAVYPDNLSTLGLSLFSINQPVGGMTGFPAVQVTRPNYKLIFSTVPLIAMTDLPPSSRREFLRKMLFDFFVLYPPSETDIVYTVRAGWNQISVAVTRDDMRYASILPTSIIIPPVYRYNTVSKVYERADTLEVGKGYFVLFMRDTSFTVRGRPINEYSVPVSGGWNMIGSISVSRPISSVGSRPSGLLLPQFYTYNPASKRYDLVTTIDPGKGYWVLAMGSGYVDFPSSGRTEKDVEQPQFFATIKGENIDLMLGVGDDFVVPVMPYPPFAEPDAYLVKDNTNAIAVVSYNDVFLMVCKESRFSFSLKDNYRLLIDLKHEVSDGDEIELQRGLHRLTLVKPFSFVLCGNYPNPFNSSTVISLVSPLDGICNLSIFDIKGQLVASFAEPVRTGLNNISLNAVGLSSGLYFYRAELDGKSAIGRMMVVK